MPKVSAHLGFTFRVGPLEQNQYGRVDLTVDQIDTELPIEPQLEESKKVLNTQDCSYIDFKIWYNIVPTCASLALTTSSAEARS